MAIKRYKVGPGTLVLGADEDVSAQVRNCRVDWSVSEASGGDAIPVLSGEEIPAEAGDPTYAATLAGNFVQDIEAGGVVEFTWANKGTEVPATFIPNTAKGRKVTGTVRIDPITLGGDAKDGAPSSDFAFPFVGDPVLGNVGP